MRYEVLRGCVIDRVARRKGDVVEITEDVNALLGMGRIIPASEPKITIDRSVGLETSADKPKRRGKNSK
jgi:hypothetical protein